jgi:hypothetical protein
LERFRKLAFPDLSFQILTEFGEMHGRIIGLRGWF